MNGVVHVRFDGMYTIATAIKTRINNYIYVYNRRMHNIYSIFTGFSEHNTNKLSRFSIDNTSSESHAVLDVYVIR